MKKQNQIIALLINNLKKNKMKYLIAYVIIAVIFESIYLIISWKKSKKEIEKKEQIKVFLNVMKRIYSQSASIKALKEKIWNWYTIPLVITPLFIIVASLIFPFTLFTVTRKGLGIKTELEKKAEVERKLMDEAQKKSEEFMKNEGECCIPVIEGEEIKDDLNDNNNDSIKN